MKGFVPDSGHWDYGVGDGVQGSWVLFVVFPLFFIFCYFYLFLLHIFPISVYIWWLILYHFQNSPTAKAPSLPQYPGFWPQFCFGNSGCLSHMLPTAVSRASTGENLASGDGRLGITSLCHLESFTHK